MATDFTKPIGAETSDERLARMQAEQAQRQVDRQNARAGTALQGTYIAPESSTQYVQAKEAGQSPASPAYAVGKVNQGLIYGISDGGANASAAKPVDSLYPMAGSGGGASPTTPGAPSTPGSTAGSDGSSSAGGSTSGGLVGSAVGGGQFQPWDVTAPQTVQQQAESIIAKDSGLMQQARGRAMQQMNERGLINSSIGIQAGQDAVMDRALQIAGQDAATYAENAKFNAGQGNAWNLSQQELALKDSQFKSEMEYKRWAVMQDFENSKVLKQLDSELGDLKSSDAAFDNQYQMYIDLLYRIDSNPDLDAAAKTTMKNEATTNLRNYAKIRGLNLDLSNLPTFEVPRRSTASTSVPTSTDGRG